MKDKEKKMLKQIDLSIKYINKISNAYAYELVNNFKEKILEVKDMKSYDFIKTLCKVDDRYFIVEWLQDKLSTGLDIFEEVYEVLTIENESDSFYRKGNYEKFINQLQKLENITYDFLNHENKDIMAYFFKLGTDAKMLKVRLKDDEVRKFLESKLN